MFEKKPADGMISTGKVNTNILSQQAVVVWLTGLSGSGKTTLAKELESNLKQDGFLSRILDGDDLRNGLNKGLGFSTEARFENIRRAAEVAKLFADSGIITICCFISPADEMREMAANIIGPERFLLVYLDCPLTVCEQRDVKGLYSKVRLGQIQQFTGISQAFEVPANPAISLRTAELNVAECSALIYHQIKPLIENNKQK